jgi:hypothetical protein
MMRSKIRIIVAGGRDFNDYDYLKKSIRGVLFELENRKLCGSLNIFKTKQEICFIGGKAKGADTLGEEFAYEFGFPFVGFAANWDLYGKKAGYLRNTEMAKYATQENNHAVLIAFWDGKSKGTENMINTAKENGIEVFVFRY